MMATYVFDIQCLFDPISLSLSYKCNGKAITACDMMALYIYALYSGNALHVASRVRRACHASDSKGHAGHFCFATSNHRKRGAIKPSAKSVSGRGSNTALSHK